MARHTDRPGTAKRIVSARRRVGRRALLGGLAVLCSAPLALAAWPPSPGATSADMKDPSNWPNDPGYGYQTDSNPAKGKSGNWQFYSFIPDRSNNAPALRPSETAAGMSIDLAWRHTIGDDRVLVAVLDSGIKWDERDLIEKAYLNKGELSKVQPQRANGAACAALDATKPNMDRFDCNGDGILTAGDYADDPRLLPDGSGGGVRGDKNQNGVFDAGDIILNFSDGVDDDNNGYVDDISGWDFMKDDNDPYDDTRYGHGTGEARDSTAATNNGMGDAGVCPLCRFVPLRVGDSFIADVQDFAQAVIYATDNGASVVQEALGTINMSRYAQRALDYAWKRGTVVVASMADENARHHNFPATANHTMPVHAITMTGPTANSTAATSFLGFNNCTNFGAQNFLSASGTGCSSEATGRLSGISGLLYSMAVQNGYSTNGSKPPLSSGEAMQIFLMTADDIDVPESRTGGSKFYYSQPGFDQRFGYGRVNANTAVEWIKDGRIPPDVDIVDPLWFQVLYKDQLVAPVPIRGSVSAKRATSYDYKVQWAPGVQPLDGEFKTLKEMTNIPAATVVGEDGSPIGEIDVRDLDISHERDPDSLLGENDYTITVRVQAVAHYGGQIGDVPGELRRAYSVHSDPDLVKGFPYYIGSSGESSPKLADIDGDGVRDIVLGTADGTLHVLKIGADGPQELSGFPFKVKALDGLDGDTSRSDYRSAPAYQDPQGVDPDLARESITAAPAVADLTGDGKLDIVVVTWSGTIYVISNDGSVAPGWPRRLPDVPSCPLDGGPSPALCMDTTHLIARGAFAAPVLADMDKDGKLDVVQAAFDGHIYAFKADGSDLPGFPVEVHYLGPTGKERNRILTTPVVTDFTGDGVPDILTGSNEKLSSGGNVGAVYLIDGRGTNAPTQPPYLPNWPISMTSLNLFPLVAEGVGNSPAAGDFDGDGVPDAVVHGNGSAPFILPADPGAQAGLSATPPNALPEHPDPNTGDLTRGLEPTAIFGTDSNARTPDVMFPLFAQPSIGDLDQDGTPDVIASGGSLSLAASLASTQPTDSVPQQLLAMWNGKTGAMFPGSPVVLEDFTFFNNQAVADISGDGYPEVMTGSGGYYVHAVDACGREPAGFPKFMGQWVVATTAVGDVTGDDKLELVVNTRAGWLYAWRTQGSTSGTIQWESFHHDNRNTGYYGEPLEQGSLITAAKPLEIDANGSCVAQALPDGGVDAGDDGGTPAANPQDVEPAGGCGCSVPQTSQRGGLGLSGLLLGLGLWLRRRGR